MSDVIEHNIVRKIADEKYRPRPILTASEELREKRLANIMKVRSAIIEDGRPYGELACPVCNSTLRFDVGIDRGVRTVNATCLKSTCIRWME